MLISYKYSTLPDRNKAVGSLVNKTLFSLVNFLSSTSFTVSNIETLLPYLLHFVSIVEFFSLFLNGKYLFLYE